MFGRGMIYFLVLLGLSFSLSLSEKTKSDDVNKVRNMYRRGMRRYGSLFPSSTEYVEWDAQSSCIWDGVAGYFLADTKYADTTGPCHCGIFDSKEVTEMDKPLISKNYMNVTCNQNGTQLCFDLCTSLAKASKERATQALCQNLEHATNLIASLYTKACDGPWQYNGITADEPICCHDKKIVGCKGITAGPTMEP